MKVLGKLFLGGALVEEFGWGDEGCFCVGKFNKLLDSGEHEEDWVGRVLWLNPAQAHFHIISNDICLVR